MAEHNIELGAGESVEQLFAQLKAEPTDELDEASLEDVSGGCIAAVCVCVAWHIGFGAIRAPRAKEAVAEAVAMGNCRS